MRNKFIISGVILFVFVFLLLKPELINPELTTSGELIRHTFNMDATENNFDALNVAPFILLILGVLFLVIGIIFGKTTKMPYN